MSTELLTPAPGQERATIDPPRSALLIGGFVAGGLVWGVVARLWMRYISAKPEFTWSGTLFIVGAFTVAATAQGLALAVRRRRSARWAQATVRGLALVLVLPLGSGAGIIMLPAMVTGSIGPGRTDWRSGWRVAFATAAVVNTVAVIALLRADLTWSRTVVGWVAMVVIYAVIVGAIALTLLPLGRGRGSAAVARSALR